MNILRYVSCFYPKCLAKLLFFRCLLPDYLVHGPGPPKMTFRRHSGGVMLKHIFGKVNYSSFLLCMIAMLNE